MSSHTGGTEALVIEPPLPGLTPPPPAGPSEPRSLVVVPPQSLVIPESPALTKFAVRSAVGLAILCIVGALFLCTWLVIGGIRSTDVLVIRVLLSCIAVFVAAAFVAIGFSLFLIKADGALKANLTNGTNAGALETSAPGLAVVVCAVVVMYFALHMKFSAADPDDPPIPQPVLKTDASIQGPDTAPLGGPMETPK